MIFRKDLKRKVIKLFNRNFAGWDRSQFYGINMVKLSIKFRYFVLGFCDVVEDSNETLLDILESRRRKINKDIVYESTTELNE